MLRQILALLFLLPLLSATQYCSNPSSVVCGANGITYDNETGANANGTIAIHCGSCSGLGTAYYSCSANYTQYGNYSNQSGSTLERYLACGFRSAIGNGVDTNLLMAMIVGGFFLAFIMMQNTRFDMKIAIIIPVVILMAVWVNWLMTLLVFALGILIYLALGKILNK